MAIQFVMAIAVMLMYGACVVHLRPEPSAAESVIVATFTEE